MIESLVAGLVGSALVGLELVAIVAHLKRLRVPRAYAASIPAAASVTAALLLLLRPVLSLFYPLGLGAGLAVARLVGGYNLGSGIASLTAVAVLALYSGAGSVSAPLVAAALTLVSVGAGLAASAAIHDEPRLVPYSAMLAVASMPLLAYHVAVEGLLLFPSGGAVTVAVLSTMLACIALGGAWWGLYASLAAAALGALAAGYAPYLPASPPTPLAAGLAATLACLAAWFSAYRPRRSPTGILAALAALLLLAPLLAGLPSSDAFALEALGVLIAGFVSSAHLPRRLRVARLALLYAGVGLLAAAVAVPVQPLAVHCRIVKLGLDGAAPAPMPSERIIHDFYLLYLGAKNESLVYALLEPRLGRSKALEMARFCHAIRVAARARGINDTYPIYALQHPQTLPALTADTDCGVRLKLPPSIALCPSSLQPGVEVNLTGYPALLHPVHVILEEPCVLARDYLVLLGDPRLTGRDALRYAIYTSMLVSYGEGRNLTDTARLLFYYALNPHARINETSVTIVYASRLHLAPLVASGSAVLAAAAVAAYIHMRKRS